MLFLPGSEVDGLCACSLITGTSQPVTCSAARECECVCQSIQCVSVIQYKLLWCVQQVCGEIERSVEEEGGGGGGGDGCWLDVLTCPSRVYPSVCYSLLF